MPPPDCSVSVVSGGSAVTVGGAQGRRAAAGAADSPTEGRGAAVRRAGGADGGSMQAGIEGAGEALPNEIFGLWALPNYAYPVHPVK
jgi:hypothetical protein